ncbi:MAG: hypothetical protein ABIK89_08495 [Planctomycetota bacterium]
MAVSGLVVFLVMLVAIGVAVVLGTVVLASIFSSERGRTFLKVLLIVPVFVLVCVVLGGVFMGYRHGRVEQYGRAEALPAEAVRERLVATRVEKAIRMDDARKRDDETSDTETSDTETADAATTNSDAAAESSAETGPAGETSAEDDPAPAEERPSWVGAAPRKVDGIYRMSISTDPYATRSDCDRELPGLLHAAVEEYATEYIGRQARVHVRLPLDYIQSEIVKEEFAEEKQIRISPEATILEEYAPMTLVHVLLEFDHTDNARIEAAWDEVIVAERLVGVGVLTTLILVLLSAVYGYLKIDLATGGAYRGRLRLAASAVILALFVAGLVLSLA